MKKPQFLRLGSRKTSARAYSKVKKAQKDSSHYYNDTRMSFDLFTNTFRTELIVVALI